MVKEGVCVFSGYDVPKGSGLIRVTNDTRSFLFLNKKVLSLSNRKINPRDVVWTAASRAFRKKGMKKVIRKEIEIQVVKEVRGFPSVPKSIIVQPKRDDDSKKKAEKGAETFRAQKKVTKAERRKMKADGRRQR